MRPNNPPGFCLRQALWRRRYLPSFLLRGVATTERVHSLSIMHPISWSHSSQFTRMAPPPNLQIFQKTVDACPCFWCRSLKAPETSPLAVLAAGLAF
jgi:hypothetical protein